MQIAVCGEVLPRSGSYLQRFQAAREAGLDGVELESVTDPDEAEAVAEASRATGLKIHSVRTIANFTHPLSSICPRTLDHGIRATLSALNCGRKWGADSMLLLAGISRADDAYGDTYARSQRVIRNEILPAARELGIVLGIENICVNFLLSPLEYVRFIDEFESEWVRANLDVGNALLGEPEQWVRATGKRILKLHVKDYRFDVSGGRFSWRRIGDGCIRWDRIRKALAAIRFDGWATNTEPVHGFWTLAANARVARAVAGSIPAGRALLWRAQRPLTVRSLRSAAQRVRALHLASAPEDARTPAASQARAAGSRTP